LPKKKKVRPYEQINHVPNKYIKNTEQDFFKITYFTESETHIFAHSKSQGSTDFKSFKQGCLSIASTF